MAGANPYALSYIPSSPRTGFRVFHADLKLQFEPEGQFFLIKDLSRCGVAILNNRKSDISFSSTKHFVVNIWYKDNRIVNRICAVIVRITGQTIALEFDPEAIDFKTKCLLDRLILNIQKDQRQPKNKNDKE